MARLQGGIAVASGSGWRAPLFNQMGQQARRHALRKRASALALKAPKRRAPVLSRGLGFFTSGLPQGGSVNG